MRIGFLLVMFSTVLSMPVPLLKSTVTASVPGDVAIAGAAIWNGTVYLSDVDKNVVMVRDPSEGGFSEFLRDPRIPAPRGLAVDGDFLYIADPIAQQVFRVNTHSKEISTLLPPNSGIRPIDLVSIPEFLRGNAKLTRSSSLAIIDANTRSVVVLAPYSANNYFDSAISIYKFRDPRSISQFNSNLLVADPGAGTLFQGSTSRSERNWFDIRAVFTPSFLPTSYADKLTGMFFPTMTHPESASGYSDFIYVIDAHKLYTYLPAKNRLIPLTYTKVPSVNPQRAIVNTATGELVLVGRSVRDYRALPIIVPMTVEVGPFGDASTPLAALYEYLWQRGTLPVTSVSLPTKTASGELCDNAACLIERVRYLLPKTNKMVETLLCQLNPTLCSYNKMRTLSSGTAIVIPDVPFEPYLYPEIRKFDGKTTIRSVVNQMIVDQSLLQRVNDGYLRDLNPKSSLTLDSVPPNDMEVRLPAQHNIYYLSVEKSEITSSNSGIAELVKDYPSLSIRPYGSSSASAARSSSQVNTSAQPTSTQAVAPSSSPVQTAVTQVPSQAEIGVHDPKELAPLEETVLGNMRFSQANASKYGRANDVPVLIAEGDLDCQHPAFFASGRDNRAFMGPQCATPEPASTPSFVDWTPTTTTDLHHGTCVASIVAGRSPTIPYGLSLASGADLTILDVNSIALQSLQDRYSLERQPSVVNISNGTTVVTADHTWRNLLAQPLVRDYFVFVASAGNDLDSLEHTQNFPAVLARDYPNLISVGALDKTGKDIWRESSGVGSNYGSRVEILAPGESVPCAIEVSQGQAVYSAPSATSFAAPLVSSVGALLLDKKLTPTEVKARILATADPMANDSLSLFGKLNVDYALLDPKMSHFSFQQQGVAAYLDADIVGGSEIRFEDLDSGAPVWQPLSIKELLSIRKMRTDPSGNIVYRLVLFNSSSPNGGTIDLKKHVLLDGCLQVQSRYTGDKYIFAFTNGCDTSQLPDQNKVIPGVDLLVAPTLGGSTFR